MDRIDEYHANEAQCRRLWEATTNPKDRADWLKLANSWGAMLRDEQRQLRAVLKAQSIAENKRAS